MDKNQSNIVQLSKRGHNVLITGFPGTGKSYLLTEIVNQFILDNKNVAVTSSTGISAKCLQECFVSKANFVFTVHKYLGLKDGRYSNEELCSLINNHERFESIKKNVLGLDCLIIDEVSMISQKMLEQIEYVCRKIRRNSFAFGGIQMVLCGDFFQLPPVPNFEFGDDGLPCYFSEIMASFHHCHLFEIYRQKEPDLIKAIMEVSRGEISGTSQQLFNRLKRPLPPGPEPVHLFATNFEVDVWNSNLLCKLDGAEKVYLSKDSGDQKILHKYSRVEQKIHLKKGAPLILLVNLSNDLVNGCQGVVKEMCEGEVIVRFKEKDFTIRPYTFSHYCPKLKRNIASRVQIPVKLAFSLTVHRSQGLTIPRVHVHCENMKLPGQITVALSRVPCKKNLRIENFCAKNCPKPSQELECFLMKEQKFPCFNLDCCKLTEIALSLTENTSVFLEESEVAENYSESELIEQDLAILQNIENTQNIEPGYEFPDKMNLNNILQQFYNINVVTEQHKEENEAVDYLKSKDLAEFADFLWSSLMKISEVSFLKDENIDNKLISKFFKAVYKFQSGAGYKSKVNLIFGGSATMSQFNIAFKLVCYLRKVIIEELAKPILEKTITKSQNEKGKVFTESSGGLGKLRYLSGWCIHSIKKKKKALIRGKLYAAKELANVQKLNSQIRLLTQMESDETVEEIERRQNIRKGLTNVNDDCASFFQNLDRQIRELESEANINLYGKNIGDFIRSSVLQNESLLTKFSSLFNVPYELDIQHLNDLFEEIVEKYCLMSLSQLRKEFIEKFRVQKTEAHRKQIQMRAGKSAEHSNFNIKSFLSDSSESKIVSHKRLQYEIAKNPDFLKDQFSKTNLKELFDFYEVPFQKHKSKHFLSETLKSKITSCKEKTQEVNPEVSPSTSGAKIVLEDTDPRPPDCKKSKLSVKVKKGKGKGKKKKGEHSYACGVCGESCTVDCVACDGCNEWFHSTCVKIEDLDSLPDEWFCQPCKEELNC